MTTLQPERQLAPVPAAPVTHPTPCPPWCKFLTTPADHHFGPTATWHWSPQYVLPNPSPLATGPVSMMRVELVRSDEGSETGEVRMYIQAEGDVDLAAAEADRFIAQIEALIDRLRAMRGEM